MFKPKETFVMHGYVYTVCNECGSLFQKSFGVPKVISQTRIIPSTYISYEEDVIVYTCPHCSKKTK